MKYVIASLLAVHGSPTDTDVAHWLRINTPVEVLSTTDTHARVSLVGRPEAHPVTGWVALEFLADQPLSAAQAAENRHGTSDVAEQRAWLERAVAIDSADREYRDLLRRHVAKMGEAVDTPQRTEVAACIEGRAMHVGHFTKEGFTATPFWDGSNQSLLDLSALHWVVASGERGRPIDGSPFAAPFTAPQWNEDGGTAYSGGTCEDICEPERTVVLGPCDTEGEVFLSVAWPTWPVLDGPDTASLHPIAEGERGFDAFTVGNRSAVLSWDQWQAWLGVGGAFHASVRLGWPAEEVPLPEDWRPVRGTWLRRTNETIGIVPLYVGPEVAGWTVLVLTADDFERTDVRLIGRGC